VEQDGYHTIHDLPDELPRAIGGTPRRAVRTGQLVVEPGLAEALEAFVSATRLPGLRDGGACDSCVEWLPPV